jgi:polysaccharide pyruvyl transferase WcaK-like protein
MARILVLIPAGEVYDHDCVRWYRAHDVQRSIEHYHNIGDAFVHDSSLKLLDFEYQEAPNPEAVTAETIDRFNAEFDYCFLRGSNYVNATMNWGSTAAFVDKLKIPVIAFGIGAQAPSSGPLVLSDETKHVLRAIADRCETVGVRGSYTSQVLWDIGVKNTRIIGCPTMFRNRDPNLRIDLPALESVRRVGYTLRREVSSTYSQDIEHYLDLQHRTILDIAARFDVTVMAQGEIEEKKLVIGNEENRADAKATLRARNWFKGSDDPMVELYENHLFYSDTVADYDRIAREQDLVLGFRLHGNLISLANRVPAIYFTYDSRTAEFVETFDIPAFDIYAGKPFEIERYWDQSLFERFNRTYHQRYRDMRQFLDENRIAHRMNQKPSTEQVRHVA